MNETKGVLVDVGLLILRVVLGVTFIIHGWGKLYSGGHFGVSEGFVKLLTDLQVPQPTLSAWFAALAEFAGGILLVAGLFPRIAALAIAGVMVVAIAKVHFQNGFSMQDKGYEYCLNLLAMSLMIVCAGSGQYSAGCLLKGAKKGPPKPGGGKDEKKPV